MPAALKLPEEILSVRVVAAAETWKVFVSPVMRAL